jgi:DNA-binding cell septation regulator SpoVG
MTYDLSPLVTRLTPFTNDGGALASVDVNFGPIMIRAKLYQTQTGYFLSWPSRKNDASEKWYEQVTIADPALRVKARDAVVRQYQNLSQGELVAV